MIYSFVLVYISPFSSYIFNVICFSKQAVIEQAVIPLPYHKGQKRVGLLLLPLYNRESQTLQHLDRPVRTSMAAAEIQDKPGLIPASSNRVPARVKG